MDDAMTYEETEKVLQFQDLTGIEDINVCRDILIRHQWDLEIAFQEHMNIREGRPSMYAASAGDNRAPQVVNDRYLQTVFTSVVPDTPPAGFTGLLRYFVNYFFSFCYSTISSIVSTLLGLFKDNERIVTDPLGDVLQFIQSYNERYPDHPVFYQGTYSQALNDAKRELKFLAVYLHTEANNVNVTNFCRRSLAAPAVIEYVNRNMLFWACDIATPEGFRVSHSVNARTYPLIVMVGLRANKMVIMARLEGDCPADELLRRLRTVVDDNDVWLSQARADRLERSLTQSLRQQQDEAYEQSLKADQEKERLKQLEREEVLRQEQAVEDERLAEQQRKEDIARQKIEMASLVPSEPEPNHPNSISVLFKLPNGQRIERRFFSTDSLKDVYNYIFCHPSSPDSFEITTNFPKRVLQTKDSNAVQTLSQIGLQNREVLFVNDLDA